MLKRALGWNVAYIKHTIPLIGKHCITLENYAKLIRQMQCRLNPTMIEVVKIEVLKLLKAHYQSNIGQ